MLQPYFLGDTPSDKELVIWKLMREGATRQEAEAFWGKAPDKVKLDMVELALNEWEKVEDKKPRPTKESDFNYIPVVIAVVVAGVAVTIATLTVGRR